MKKVLGYLFVFMLALFPFTLKAVTADDEKVDLAKFNKAGLKEILAEEGIKEEFTNYSETDNQVTIYLFRGNGCGYCRSFLSFLNSIADEYGKYFKVVGFEVWYDANNWDLMKNISKFMGSEAGGVPYIIIGEQAFPGYASEYDDEIKNAILTQFNAKERYDAIDEYNKAISKAQWATYGTVITSILFNLIFISVATYIVIRYIKKSNQELLDKLSEKKHSKEPVKEVKSETKVVKKKNAKKKK